MWLLLRHGGKKALEQAWKKWRGVGRPQGELQRWSSRLGLAGPPRLLQLIFPPWKTTVGKTRIRKDCS